MMADDKRDETRRPITLHVLEVIDDVPDMEHHDTVPVRTIDLELTYRDAIKLRDYLSKRIEKHHAGTIRARCKGRMVI